MRWFSLVVLAACLALGPGRPVSAHRFEHPRQLRVGLDEGRLVVSMVFDLDPGEPSRTARQLFDRDADGRVDETERALLEAWMERTALRAFRVRAGARAGELARLELETVRRDGHRTGLPSHATETLGLSLLLAAPLPEAPGELWLELEDEEPDRRKHVPLLLDLAPAWSLRFASQGEWHPAPRQLHRVALSAEHPLVLRVGRGPLPPAAPSPGFSWCLP